MMWRVVMTDSESLSGVAPVCETVHEVNDDGEPLSAWVYDCCPWPQLELWSEVDARRVVEILNEAGAGVAGT